MSNNTVSSRVLGGVFFAVLLAVSGIASCGSGEGSTTVITPTALTLSLVPSRTTGVAPLAVFFDATGTTDTGVTTRPFHDLQYTWSFGDTAGSPVKGTTWSTGSQAAVATCSPPYNGCRNNATGAVAAHVFENTGTFTVTLTVFDGITTITKTQDITVTPFSGTPYCIHNSTPLNSGICNGVEHATTGDVSTDVANAISAGAKQILFNRGDSFATTTNAIISAAGPGIIGSYGSGAIPIITTSSTINYNYIFNFTSADWRLMDIDLEGGGGLLQFGTYAANQTTYLRVTTGNLNYGYNARIIDGLAIQDSTVKPGADAGIGLYCATCTRVMLLGNSMYLGTAVGGYHDIRLQGTNYFVLENSDQTGSLGAPATINGFTIRGNSQYGEISDNDIISYDSQIQPQNNLSFENQHDIVVERNFFTASQLLLQGNHVTVRNNIFNMSGYVKPNSQRAVDISWQFPTSPAPTENFIYNNTVYTTGSSVTGSFFAAIGIEANMAGSGCNLTTGNNLAYIPNGTSQVYLIDLSGGAGCSINGSSGTNGNSTDNQVKNVSPIWVNGSTFYSVPTDFIPNCTTAYPCQQGAAAPLWTDFFGKIRTSPYDTGAVNH